MELAGPPSALGGTVARISPLGMEGRQCLEIGLVCYLLGLFSPLQHQGRVLLPQTILVDCSVLRAGVPLHLACLRGHRAVPFTTQPSRRDSVFSLVSESWTVLLSLTSMIHHYIVYVGTCIPVCHICACICVCTHPFVYVLVTF